MKTVILKRPGEFVFEDTPAPDSPGSGEVIVRVKHVGLCGTDISAFHGRMPFLEYPRILGHELGVIIEALGEGVTDLEVGQHCSVEAYLAQPGDLAFSRGKTNCTSTTQCLGVHVDGGMREWFLVPAEKLHPSTLGTEHLALVEMLCIGNHAVERAALLGDEVIAVIGVGPIGLGAVQFSRQSGTKVIAVDVSGKRLEKCKAAFPDVETLQITPGGEPLVDAWKAAFGTLPEVVIECTGNNHSMEASIGLPDFGGRIVLVGIYSGDLTFNDPDFHKRELSIISSRNATARNFKDVIQQLEFGNVNPDTWITHHCTAEEFPSLIETWLKPESGLVKGIISF
ncbi:MAG: alcohol dehydrogenase catalytic domain-containing protein [Verrucomicrobia bacterium]|nr:alcohol dehydrogenase catalytic domain-containing protein [Verrucomicrobiota bacterium]